jgi:peptidoglycan/xylan/chitin deacetylase (PgdA/CDA1 family)
MLKSAVIAAMELSGLSRALTPWYAGRGVIFTGHRVLRDDTPTLIPGNAVTASQLTRMVSCIRDAGWEIVPLESVPALLAQKSGPRFACLTFDDGFADNWHVATPLLRAANAPFAVFPVVNFIDRKIVPSQELLEWLVLKTNHLDLKVSDGIHIRLPTATMAEKLAAFAQAMSLVWRNVPGLAEALAEEARKAGATVETFMNETFMTWDELRQLAHTPGVSIGTHSMNHRPLAALDAARAEEELRQPRALLQERLQVPVTCTAYPFGSAKECGAREYELAKAAGYGIGLTTRPGNIYREHAGSTLSLPRVTISMVPHASSDRFIRTSMRGVRNALLNRGRRRAP